MGGAKESRFDAIFNYNPTDSSLPWHRRALGDTWLNLVQFGRDAPEAMIEQVRKTFPEAVVAEL